MAGLQAHDFEAYQEMLAEKQGADGGRYEAISKFLTETEEYLNRLAGKVAHVRAGQQAAEAQAKAIAEAIAQVGAPDVIVRLTANQRLQKRAGRPAADTQAGVSATASAQMTALD